MELSNGEIIVMEMLWDGECLDENGEIQAIELAKLLYEKHGIGKTSCYTFLGRLLEKGAISRRHPKYTVKPIVPQDVALKEQRRKAITCLFQGSLANVCRTFVNERKISKKEIEELKNLIENFTVDGE